MQKPDPRDAIVAQLRRERAEEDAFIAKLPSNHIHQVSVSFRQHSPLTVTLTLGNKEKWTVLCQTASETSFGFKELAALRAVLKFARRGSVLDWDVIRAFHAGISQDNDHVVVVPPPAAEGSFPGAKMVSLRILPNDVLSCFFLNAKNEKYAFVLTSLSFQSLLRADTDMWIEVLDYLLAVPVDSQSFGKKASELGDLFCLG